MQNITQAAAGVAHAFGSMAQLPSQASELAAFARETGLELAANSSSQLSALNIVALTPGKIGELALIAGVPVAVLLGARAYIDRQANPEHYAHLREVRADRPLNELKEMRTDAGHRLPYDLTSPLQRNQKTAMTHAYGYKLESRGEAAAADPARALLKGTTLFFHGGFPAQEHLLLEMAYAATGRHIDSISELNQLMAAAGNGPDGVPALTHPDHPDRPLFTQLNSTTVFQDTRPVPGRMNPGGYMMRVGGRYCTIVPTSKPGPGAPGLAIRFSTTRPVDGNMLLKPNHPMLSTKRGEEAALVGKHVAVSLRTF